MVKEQIKQALIERGWQEKPEPNQKEIHLFVHKELSNIEFELAGEDGVVIAGFDAIAPLTLDVALSEARRLFQITSQYLPESVLMNQVRIRTVDHNQVVKDRLISSGMCCYAPEPEQYRGALSSSSRTEMAQDHGSCN